MILRSIPCALALAAVCFGCGYQEQRGAANFKQARQSESAPAAKMADGAGGFGSTFSAPASQAYYAEAGKQAAGSGMQANGQQQGDVLAGAFKPAQSIDQKIIYTGHLSVVARDFDQAEPKVREVVKKHKAYIADAQVQRNQGTRPTATWAIRVPAENFDDCLHDLAGLGVPESQKVGTQDVGEEYVDVQARVASKKKVEDRILEMLKDRKGDLKEIMDLEAKLGAVREEIERAQGRLNFLSNRVAFSTINLTLREEREYVPPQTPDFAGQVADAWKASSGSFIRFAQQVALFAIAVAPWLPLWLLLGVAAWAIARRIHRAAVPRATA